MRARAVLALVLLTGTVHATGWVEREERPDPSASPLARRGGTIRFNGSQPPKSFNAYVDNNSYSSMVFDLMYDRLLGTDSETAELVPALARRWAVSDDGREFTFELDPRATWSDGVSVTAADVKWTFDRVMDPKSDTGPWKSVLGFFESPEIVDRLTVRFRKKGDSPKDWRDILNCSTFWILPEHVFGGADFNRLEMVGAPVGGPYLIARAEEQVETELRRHGRWWRQNLLSCRNLYNFDRILVRYFVDNENAFEALKKRQIDVYPVYTARIMAQETHGEKFDRNWLLKRRVRNHSPVGFQGFAMNMRRFPFDDVRVRRAMAMLIDRETMNRTMMNSEYFLLSSYYQDLYDAEHPCPNALVPFDPEGAARLLAEAGWRKDAEGTLRKDGRAFEFTFLSRGTTEDKFLALFNHQLGALGIRLSIVRKDFAGWMRDMDGFSYDMTWANWGAGVIKNPEVMWLGSEADRKGSNNITGFRSEAVDRLIVAEKGMERVEDRNRAYREIDALIFAECPYALLWQVDETRLIHWNKFGMPATALPRFAREEAVLAYWWYDEDRARELDEAIAARRCLPTVPERVEFDAQRRK